ncbi:MAG: divergent polysaccharide deacetylase family protein [Clostridia bacterium]|nr:divergent polysaccharide deacetylase family protein [Clostridia bacterium]
MKKVLFFLLTFLFFPFQSSALAKAETIQPMLAIVIDDFGSYDESGVNKLLNLNEPITAAVLPNTDMTNEHILKLSKTNFEIILHMPMESHVRLPENWYGPTYIKNFDDPETVKKKIDNCIKKFPKIKGFNSHIGSGVSRNERLMKAVYEFANSNNLYFLDSRTIETKATESACSKTGSLYLGRDVFLEANKNKTYSGVCFRLNEASNIAKQNGFAIAIGHVGAEGGENTAQAIIDMIPKLKENGIKIVPLSTIYEYKKSQINLKSTENSQNNFSSSS